MFATGGNNGFGQVGGGFVDFDRGINFLSTRSSGAAETVLASAGYSTVYADGGNVVMLNLSGYLDFQAFTRVSSTVAASTVFGGFGSITISGAASDSPGVFRDDLFVGGSAGHNAIKLQANSGTVFGGGDGDVLLSVADTLPEGLPYRNKGNLLVAGRGAETINAFNEGNANANVLVGGSGPDLLSGGQNDTIIAGTGPTTVYASGGLTQLGSGAATVILETTDTLIGGSGAATVFAQGTYIPDGIGNFPALVFGGAGSLTFVNEALGADTVRGGTGSVIAQGGDGGGLYYGGADGGTMLFAGKGAATLVAGGDGDRLAASGAAADILVASTGNETLDAAGTGADVLFAGTGNTDLRAGAGADLFVFQPGLGGSDTIEGFQHGLDHVTLSHFAPTAARAALAGATASGAGVLLTLSDQTKILFSGISTLTAADFV